jgi:hypothetical protein
MVKLRGRRKVNEEIWEDAKKKLEKYEAGNGEDEEEWKK